VLVDVSGKGVQAGTRSLLLSGALGGLLGEQEPNRFLTAANNYLLRQNWDEGFATAVHVSIDLATGDYTIGTIRKDIWRSTFFHIDDVAGIEERPGKGLVVRSSSGRHIDVPAQIIGYAEIRAALEKWQPIHVIAGS